MSVELREKMVSHSTDDPLYPNPAGYASLNRIPMVSPGSDYPQLEDKVAKQRESIRYDLVLRV